MRVCIHDRQLMWVTILKFFTYICNYGFSHSHTFECEYTMTAKNNLIYDNVRILTLFFNFFVGCIFH